MFQLVEKSFIFAGSQSPPSDEGGGFCEAKDGGREVLKSLTYQRTYAKTFSPSVAMRNPDPLRNMVALPSLERRQISLFLHLSTSLHPLPAAFRCFALVRGSLISRFLLSFVEFDSQKRGCFFTVRFNMYTRMKNDIIVI